MVGLDTDRVVEDTPSLLAKIAKEQNPKALGGVLLPSIMNHKFNKTFQIKPSQKMNKTLGYDCPARLGTVDTVQTPYLEPLGDLLATPLNGDLASRPSANFGGPVGVPGTTANFGDFYSSKYKKT